MLKALFSLKDYFQSQWVKELAAKPSDLSLISETHMVEGESRLLVMACSKQPTSPSSTATKL